MQQLESHLPAAEIELSADVLDRIDEIVPPSVNLNPADGGWQSPALEPAARRRYGLSRPRSMRENRRRLAEDSAGALLIAIRLLGYVARRRAA